jgi:hypothetical protein
MTENEKKKKTQKKVYAKGYRTEKKVTANQVLRCLYKWLKVIFWDIEHLKESLESVNQLLKSLDERIARIEAFLGGTESMDKILSNPDPNTYKPESPNESKGETNADS